jgi:hypothetical protein
MNDSFNDRLIARADRRLSQAKVLLTQKANVPWLGCGVADFGLTEQRFHGIGLVQAALSAP